MWIIQIVIVTGNGIGHGSHCSGTVAAIGDNGKGVPGVIPDNIDGKFELFIGKALSDSGSGTLSGVMEAVIECINQGAKVVSLSLGGGGFSQTTSDFFKEHYDNGVLFVAAAGNGVIMLRVILLVIIHSFQ